MSPLRKAITFYLLTLALAVLVRAAVPLLGEWSLPVTMLTPAVAVACMLLFIAPEQGLRGGFSDLGITRAGLPAWPLAITAPVLIHAASLLILVAAGLTQLDSGQASQPLVTAILNCALSFAVGALFALTEEVGWRGYLQPRLMEFGAVAAMLLTGFLHGVWHLPLMLTTNLYHSTGNTWIVTPMFLLAVTLAGVFFGYLRLVTDSVWPVAFAHAATNLAWGITRDLSATKSALALEYVGGESGLVMIVGLLLFDAVLIGKMRSNVAATTATPHQDR